MKGFKFDKPYQTATISAGSSGVVWNMNVPHSYVAFIDSSASNFFADCYFVFEIDNEKVEKFNITRTLGNVDDPKKWNPPLISKSSIKVTAFNNSSGSITFEVYLDGTIYEDKI